MLLFDNVSSVRSWPIIGAVCLCLATTPVSTPQARIVPEVEVEVRGVYKDLSDGFANTRGVNLITRISRHPQRQWVFEASHLDRFGEGGTFLSGMVRQAFGPVFYANLAGGVGLDGFFWPAYRIDASVGRHWLAQQNLLTAVGVGYVEAKDDHQDIRYFADLTYYLNPPWVVQTGMAVNDSDPGNLLSASGYVALSYVGERRFIVAKISGGNQSYQALGAQRAVVDFPFHAYRLHWKEHLGTRWGISVVGESFLSDVYDEHGVEIGFFYEF